MKKYLLSLAAMLFFSITVQSQVVVYEDNFDSYTTGEQLTLENSVNWTTWSGAPGTAEDPIVSDEYASSDPNAVKITGTNDVVMLLGDQTAGKYNVMFKMYIPAGNLGYFNILHLFAGTNSEWGLQVYFDLGGIGIVDGNGAGAGAFTFNYDEWIDVKANINLDDDWCMFYINGNLVHEYQWSKGTFGTGTLNQLGGMNLFAWNEGGNPLYYVEDVVYELVTESLIVEDFESYNAGQPLVQQAVAQGKDYWTTWSSTPGSAEDPLITTDQSTSGSNSVVIEGTNDAVLLLGDKVTAAYAVEFNIYIPNGNLGYFNLLQVFAGAQSEWGMQAFFDQGGLGTVDAGGQGAGVFSYSYDTWIPVKVDVDLNADFAELFVNGNSVITWVWSSGSFGTGTINQLAAMNLYAWAEGGVPKAYFDDITFTQTAPPGGNPEIIVSPTSLSETLDVGQTSSQMLTITNVGVVDLDYSILVTYVTDNKTKAASNNSGNVTFEYADGSVITADDLAVVTGLSSPSAPENTDDEVILNYDGENSSAVGLTNGGTYEVAAKFPADMVGQYIGMEITEVQVYINDPANGYKLKIYGQDLPNRPGELLYEQLFSATSMSWNTISLWTPLINSGGDLWVAYEIVQNLPGVFPAGTDAGPAHPEGDWIKTGASWAKLSVVNPDLNYNWNIRAKLVGDPIQAWLEVDPGMGSIEPNQSEQITVNFSAVGLTAGTYEASIKISSNDPVTPMFIVPVTLEVGGTIPLDPPTNLESEVIGNDILLTWEAPAGPQPPFYEDFEGTFPPAGWLKLSPDGGTGWEPLMVGTTPIPGWNGGEATAPPNGGSYQAFCTWTTGGAAMNDQWLITPQLTVESGSMLEFYMVYYFSSFIDYVEVLISTTNQNTPSAFDVVVDQISFDASSSTDWQLYSYNLTDYVSAGTEIYIAFREMVSDNTNDGSAIAIDNVYVGQGTFLAEITDVPAINPAPMKNGSIERNPNYVHVPNTRSVSQVLEGFNVYRNSVKINETLVTDTEYLDENLSFGTYTYYVTAVYDIGESGPSNEVTEVITSVYEPEVQAFNIYPNPATDAVTVYGNALLKQVRIMNYTGQVVYQNVVNNSETTISTRDLSSGVYILQIETQNGWSSRKLMIK
jgi:hypothetical protein